MGRMPFAATAVAEQLQLFAQFFREIIEQKRNVVVFRPYAKKAFTSKTLLNIFENLISKVVRGSAYRLGPGATTAALSAA